MRKYYCTCLSKTHKTFYETKVDADKCCVLCGYYATLGEVRVTKSTKRSDPNGIKATLDRTKEITEYMVGRYTLWGN